MERKYGTLVFIFHNIVFFGYVLIGVLLTPALRYWLAQPLGPVSRWAYLFVTFSLVLSFAFLMTFLTGRLMVAHLSRLRKQAKVVTSVYEEQNNIRSSTQI